MTRASAVGELIALAGGTIEGRTRLQKSDYFLESRGLGFGFPFVYHYFGPFSEALALAVEDAAALGIISAELHRSSSGSRHHVFRSGPQALAIQNQVRASGPVRKRKEVLDVLSRYDAVALELAATADFLSKSGHGADCWQETIRRKRAKATESRIAKAKALLQAVETIAASG